jgi:hypothetical protein
MSETFFGQWKLRGKSGESQFLERFVISDSDGSDGIFELADDGTPVDLAVSGNEWTIQFQARLESTDWFSYDPDRTTRFVPNQGLTVVLAIAAPVKPGGGLVFAHPLVVQLVSCDPALSPPIGTNPFDFSLPK